MAFQRRLSAEFESVKEAKLNFITQVEQLQENTIKWTGLLLPSNPPYNKAAFRIEILFPDVYPFLPPAITFKTPIYHPNIDDNGTPCLPIISPENWKPTFRMEFVLNALVALVNCPQLEHPLKLDLAELLSKHPKKFNKMAEDWGKTYGEQRPNI